MFQDWKFWFWWKIWRYDHWRSYFFMRVKSKHQVVMSLVLKPSISGFRTNLAAEASLKIFYLDMYSILGKFQSNFLKINLLIWFKIITRWQVCKICEKMKENFALPIAYVSSQIRNRFDWLSKYITKWKCKIMRKKFPASCFCVILPMYVSPWPWNFHLITYVCSITS